MHCRTHAVFVMKGARARGVQETRCHDSWRSECARQMCRKTAHAVRKVSATCGSSAAVAASPREQLLPLLMDFCRGTWHARLHGSGHAQRSGRRMKKDALDAAQEPPCLAQPTLGGGEVLQDAAKWVWHVAFCNAGQCAALRRSVLRGEVTVALERPRLLALPPRLREAVEGMAAAEESRVGSKRECWCVGSWCQWCDCERGRHKF